MSAGSARLTHALKTMRERWSETRTLWADKQALDFEKNHIEPLQHDTKHASIGMEKVAEVLRSVKQECS
jgi:hypothetical protein